MRIDVSAYWRLRPTVKSFNALHPEYTDDEMIGKLTMLTGAPIIALCHLLAEVRGWTPEITAKAAFICEFYKYDEVIPLEPENVAKD